MSYGGEESKKGSDSNVRRGVGVDEYGRAAARVAVAQICQSVGFECTKQSAMEALSNVAVRYICDLGKSAGTCANLAGRSECNVFDVVKGLEDLGSSVGFSGASEADHCPLRSGVLKEIIEFVDTAEEVPFAHPIPEFPVTKSCKGIPSFSQMGETPSGNHIPSWLPAFPDLHTYVHSPMWNERKTDAQADKMEQARQRRKAETSLLNLQQRLLVNDGAGPSGLSNHAEENPFFAAPLSAAEKDVSHVALPVKLVEKEKEKEKEKNRGPVQDAFAPAIDAMKSGLSDPMDCDRSVLPNRRPVVQFRLKGGRKMVGEDLDVSLRSIGRVRNAALIGRDEEKDEKKRRAEMILRQSMENPQDLTQM